MSTFSNQFLFLQGPHGPFFASLARTLRRAGCGTLKVGFNAGDRAFWRGPYFAFRDSEQAWPETFERLLTETGTTDLVLYGDIRSRHAEAIQIARRRGLRIHIFEEGYMRPYWATYERGGSNGHSRLMTLDLDTMEEALDARGDDPIAAPASWGDLAQHIFYGALYHWAVVLGAWAYPKYRSHRDMSVTGEGLLYTARLLAMPVRTLVRIATEQRVRLGRWPYHLMCLQLDHDSNFVAHAPYGSNADVLEEVIPAFAASAPAHHHLVIKAHPLDPGVLPLGRIARRLARAHGAAGRVHVLRGGKLAPILDQALTMVTVNSTAAHQALFRGLPVKALGQSIYNKPGLVSDQTLEAFFAAPTPPDKRAYGIFRRFLLATSQFPGGYYAARSRRQLIRRVVDAMLAPTDPYGAILPKAPMLRVVPGRKDG